MGFYKEFLKLCFLTLLISVEIRGIRLSHANSNNGGGNGNEASSGGGGGKSSSRGHSNTKEQLNVGLIAPHTNFGKREYLRAINTAVQSLPKTRGTKLTFLQHYIFDQKNVIQSMMSLTPSPTGTLFAFLEFFSVYFVSFCIIDDGQCHWFYKRFSPPPPPSSSSCSPTFVVSSFLFCQVFHSLLIDWFKVCGSLLCFGRLCEGDCQELCDDATVFWVVLYWYLRTY